MLSHRDVPIRCVVCGHGASSLPLDNVRGNDTGRLRYRPEVTADDRDRHFPRRDRPYPVGVTSERPLIGELLAEFSSQLAAALWEADEADLAATLGDTTIWGRCGCGDDFCSSFYTGPTPAGTWQQEGFEYRNVSPSMPTGIVNLDVVDGVIRYVEVLYLSDVKDRLATVDAVQRP
jgi:hypothetical protein